MSAPVVIGGATLYQGDALEILPTLKPYTVQALITDPPYMIGAVSVGNANAKSGGLPDMENASWWFSEWLKAGKRTLQSTGHSCVFTNWRGMLMLQYAYGRLDWQIDSLMVWDKEWIGPAGPKQLRPTYEMVVFATMPDAKIDNRSAADVFRCKWLAAHCKTSVHPAEKPVELMRHLVRLTTKPHDVALDCFMGSGTTGVAAALENRRFIGIERDPRYFDVACQRIEDATRQEDMFVPATRPAITQQSPLFEAAP